MHRLFIPLYLCAAFSCVLVAVGMIAVPAAIAVAREGIDRSETENYENVFVQACDGFDLTTSYTTDRRYHIDLGYHGIEVFEEMDVEFVGTIGSAKTGESFHYEGQYVRRTGNHREISTNPDSTLQVTLTMTATLTVSMDRVEPGLVADPPLLLKTLVPDALRIPNLCSMFGDAVMYGTAIDPPSTVPEPCDLMPQDPARPQCPNPCILDGSCPPEGVTL